MRISKTINAAIIAAIMLSSCASSSDNISASYVSPLQYQGYNCDQTRMEMQRVSRRVNEIAGVQDGQASKDAVALGVGLVLFWPALFFMIGKDKEEELSRLKGEYEALEQAAIQRNCNIAAELEAARKMQEERAAKKANQAKETGKPNE
ncbi:MAG: hypothetical protein ACXW30_01370 [Micavibrio sp.]